MCCGQKRSELRNSQTQGTTRTVPQYVPSYSRTQAVQTPPWVSPETQAASPQPPGISQTRGAQPQARVPLSVQQPSVSVRYLETSPIRVRGLVSGRSYEFSSAAPVQQVDARDATSLLNTRFFRRAS
jgi:hypothetical protein